MPGNSLNITLPTVGATTGPSYATQINAAIQTLIDDVEAKIVPAELDINADVDFSSGGTSYGAENLQRLNFTEQGTALAGGSYVNSLFDVNGELYYQDGAGNNVQLTSGGSLGAVAGNITTTGSPAYAASGVELQWAGGDDEYRFFGNGGGYADLVFSNLEFRNGSNTMTMSSGVTSDYSIAFPSAGPSANDLAYFDGSGNITFSGTIPGAKTFSAALTASAGITVGAGGVDVTGASSFSTDVTLASNSNLVLQGTGAVRHGEYTVYYSASMGAGVQGSGTLGDYRQGSGTGGAYYWEAADISAEITIPIPLAAGERIVQVEVFFLGGSGASKTFRLWEVTNAAVVSAMGSETTTTSGTGSVVIDAASTSSTLPHVIVTDRQYLMTFNAGVAGDRVYGMTVTYDRLA